MIENEEILPNPAADPDWFKKWFNRDYLALYSHRNLAEADKLLQLLIEHGWLDLNGRIIDVACGAGRHLSALLLQNADIYGIDLSSELLKIAVKKISPGKGSRLGIADMRYLPFKNDTFTAALNLFTSFGYFENDANLLTLNEIKRILRPNGIFVLDHFNKKKQLSDMKPISFHRIGSMLAEERRIFNLRTNRIQKTIILHKGEQIEEFCESVKCYELDELTDIMSKTGFRIQAVYGDYNGKQYSAKSPRMIIIGVKN